MNFFKSFDGADEKVGGQGLFKDISKAQLLGGQLIGSAVSDIEDKFNTAKDLQARAALAPTEALLRNKVELPSTRNQTRQLMGNVLGVDQTMQNIAEAQQAKVDRADLMDFFKKNMENIKKANAQPAPVTK